MTPSGEQALSDHLRRFVLRSDRAGRTDGQLLEAFVSQRDAAAFEALLRRHGPMVLGVCRRVLGDPHDAEDAFQATFLVLARKAATVSPREAVGNWLYGVAHTTAVRARSANARRRARERQVADMPEPPAARKDLADDLRQTLDEELARLPEKYRTPVVLCDLEGRPRREVARQLKLPEGTLSSRLTTARRMLAGRLARHGLAVSAGSLAAALSAGAATASVPTSLACSTAKAVLLTAAGQAATGILPAPVAALAEGVLKDMFLSKLKGVVVLLSVLLAGVGSGGLLYRTQAADAREALRAQRREAAKKERSPLRRPEDDPASIRGVWRVIAAHQLGGEDAGGEAKRWEGSRWVIDAGAVDIRMKDGGALGCTYRLDPSRRPGTLDLTVRGHTTAGVYALEGDVLKIRLDLREARLRSLVAGESGNMLCLILKREPVPRPKAPAGAGEAAGANRPARTNDDHPRSDGEKLQGTWEVVSRIDDGKKDEPGDGRPLWTIRGRTLKIGWPAGQTPAAPTAYHRFRLDETTPRRIDLVAGRADDLFDTAAFDRRLDDTGDRVEGIYALRGDTLTLCVSREKKGERPTFFESSKGSGRILLTLRKQGPREAFSAGRREGGSAARPGNTPETYQAIFTRALAVMDEQFEQITYVNRYDGRIEASGPGPVPLSDVTREASLSIQPYGGGVHLTVRVTKVRTGAGGERKVIGHDEDLEWTLLDRLTRPRRAEGAPRGRR